MLNHFANDNKAIAAIEKVLSPLTKHLGWRTDLALQTVLDGTPLHVTRKQHVNPLRLWALVECINEKNVNGMTHINGVKNGNGAAATHISTARIFRTPTDSAGLAAAENHFGAELEAHSWTNPRR